MAGKKEDVETVLPRLVQIALFKDFDVGNEDDRRILSEVYEHMSIRNIRKGEVIICEGDSGAEFYILRKGTVHISRKTPAGDSIALADLNDQMNIFFGEAALIGNDTRSATVEAVTDCVVACISGKKFNEICIREPVLGFRVYHVLAERMAETIRSTNKDKTTLYEALFDEISGIVNDQ